MYYGGTAEKWNEVVIASSNDNLTDATIRFGNIKPEPEKPYVAGNLNGDDRLSFSDALKFLQHAVGTIKEF